MSTKELACSIIDSLTEEQLDAIVVILSGMCHYEEPNEETKQVIMEAEQGINLSRPFNSVEELGEDLNADDQISQ